MRVLIVGCGYVGLPLGAELVRQGHQVFGVRRSTQGLESLRTAGIHACQVDITEPQQWQRLPGPFDWVVNLVSSGHGGPEEYQRVYVDGTKSLINWLTEQPPSRFVYTSSTGVYGQTDSSQVKETSPTEPASPTSRILVQAENLLRQAFQEKSFPAITLRVAGIYGPERGHHFRQFLRNEVRIPGKGERIMNMIHLDDLVGIILATLKDARPGEIYNVVDDEPVMQVHFFRWLSETLGKWMPPFSEDEEQIQRKRGATSKKVLNRKLKMELGYKFKYPTFRQGYSAEIQRLDQAGLLEITPDPR